MSRVPAPRIHPLPMVPIHALCAEMAITPPVAAQGIDTAMILYKVHSPYVPEAWRLALDCTRLTQLFPNLIHDLTYGSPIKNPLL